MGIAGGGIGGGCEGLESRCIERLWWIHFLQGVDCFCATDVAESVEGGLGCGCEGIFARGDAEERLDGGGVAALGNSLDQVET